MINGICISNAEGFHCDEWPQEFMALPRIGDGVRKDKSLETMYITNVIHEIFGGKPRILIWLSQKD